MDHVQTRLNRALRMRLICEAVQASGKTGSTMEELAEQGGLTRSPYLAQVVRDLLALGCVEERFVRNHTGRAVTVYFALKPYVPA